MNFMKMLRNCNKNVYNYIDMVMFVEYNNNFFKYDIIFCTYQKFVLEFT